MSQSITVRSFAELADLLDFEVTDSPAPSEGDALEGSDASAAPRDPASDLSALLTRLEQATADLAVVAIADREARDLAQKDLERIVASLLPLIDRART